MSTTTIDMLVARVDILEKQLALLLKDKGEVKKDTKKKLKDDTSSDDDEVKTKKEVKKGNKGKKSKEDTSDDEVEVKKKRGPSGYILFSNENREDVKAQLCVGDDKPKNTDVMKQLAQLWQNIGAEEKAKWNAKAKEANAVVE